MSSSERFHYSDLEPLDAAAVLRALADTSRSVGVEWEPEGLQLAVAAAGGYPFTAQLIGQHAWELTGYPEPGATITSGTARQACARAQQEMSGLMEDRYTRCTPAEQQFMLAMAATGDGPARRGEIAERMGVGSNHVSNQRDSLLKGDLIRSAAYGTVEFTIPGMAAYLRGRGESGPRSPWGFTRPGAEVSGRGRGRRAGDGATPAGAGSVGTSPRPGRPGRLGGPVEYRSLGRTGVQVSTLCLGAMMFGQWGNPDHDESIAIIHAALDAGVNFVDTADVYSQGESEQIVGEALKALGSRRDDVVLATKVHSPMGEERNHRGNSRRWIVAEVDDSLRRLQTDHIDLYQVHRPDPDVHVEETLSALTDLQRAGKIRYFGSSTFPAHQIVQAQWVAEQRGLSRFVTEQPPYSMLVRAVEADVLPVAQEYSLGVLAWSPLAGGWLSGRYRLDADVPASTRAARLPARYDLGLPENRRKLEAADALGTLADESGLTLIQMAVAFVTNHPAVTSAIIGPRTHEHLRSQLAAADVTLSPDLLERIDEIVPPGTTFAAGDRGYLPPALTRPALRRRG